MITDLANRSVFRGRGLLARFLYASPASRIGERQIAPHPVPDLTDQAYTKLIRTLQENPPKGTLKLNNGAVHVFRDWQREVEAMLADGGELEAIRDWGSKLAGATARLAAILHCVKYRDATRYGVIDTSARGSSHGPVERDNWPAKRRGNMIGTGFRDTGRWSLEKGARALPVSASADQKRQRLARDSLVDNHPDFYGRKRRRTRYVHETNLLVPMGGSAVNIHELKILPAWRVRSMFSSGGNRCLSNLHC